MFHLTGQVMKSWWLLCPVASASPICRFLLQWCCVMFQFQLCAGNSHSGRDCHLVSMWDLVGYSFVDILLGLKSFTRTCTVHCHLSSGLFHLSESPLYIIIRKTWKGMNQTKMEGGTERHLPKTDDWRFFLRQHWRKKEWERDWESYNAHLRTRRRQSSVLGKLHSVPPSIFVKVTTVAYGMSCSFGQLRVESIYV